MLGQERQRELLHYLRTVGTGHVGELSELLGTSASTVRRDLDALQERGLVERVHGGATITDIGGEARPHERAGARTDEKRRIGEQAARLVQDGSTILISGGTTTEHMMAFLGGRSGLTVITNGLRIATGLAHVGGITVVVLGGLLREGEMSLLGHLTTQAVQDFQIDVAFTGAFGVDPVHGLTGMNLGETQTDRALVGSASRLVVLADCTKLTQRGPVRLAAAEGIDVLVTDDSAPDETVKALRAQGIEVITC